MCATASSAATTFAARTGQLMRDMDRLHNSAGLALEVLAGGTTHPSRPGDNYRWHRSGRLPIDKSVNRALGARAVVTATPPAADAPF
jgi:hypothetical protein